MIPFQHPPLRARLCPGRARVRQGGAATLVVVMLLFFVISLTAAYAARNLIFEQRTAANQYRASQAVEAAQAGLEWAAAMLNGGRIDDACQPSTDVTQTSFRERYVAIDPTTGIATRRFRSDGSTLLWAACQFDGTAWRCSCPTNAAPTVAAPTGAGPFPAFGVRFSLVFPKSGLLRAEVNGCNSFDIDCITRVNGFNALECRSTLCSQLALHQGVRLIPAAPVTARGVLQGTGLTVSNADPSAGGLTVHTGIASPASFTPTLIGPSGMPPELTRADGDGSLQTLAPDADDCAPCMFSAVFGINPALYREQPATVSLDCAAACTAAQVNALIAVNPDRMIRLAGVGGLDLSGGTDIGSITAPVVLWIDGGPLTLGGGYTGTVHGLVYAGAANIASGTVRGAIVSSGDITTVAPGAARIDYDRTLLTRLMHTSGSFVRVPGTWRDFQ